jgi:hypothetical protein
MCASRITMSIIEKFMALSGSWHWIKVIYKTVISVKEIIRLKGKQ